MEEEEDQILVYTFLDVESMPLFQLLCPAHITSPLLLSMYDEINTGELNENT